MKDEFEVQNQRFIEILLYLPDLHSEPVCHEMLTEQSKSFRYGGGLTE